MTKRIFRIMNLSGRLIENHRFDKWASGVSSPPDNWTSVNTPTVTQSSSNVVSGVYSVRVQNASTEADRGVYQDVTDSIVTGETYYISVMVTPAAGTVRLIVWDGGGTSNPVTASSTGTSNQRLIVKKVAPSTGLRIALIARTAGADGYFSMVQTGTGYVEFIEGEQDTTFRITDWRETVADYKGGGELAGSTIGDNSAMVAAYWENAVQTVDFHIKGRVSQDNVAQKLGELARLCYSQANRYGFDNSVPDPVYIETKTRYETNSRFALVVKATVPEIPDAMGIEFEQLHLLDASLIVQHKQWLSVPPGEGKARLIGNRETYNGIDFGTVNSSGTFDPAKGERSAWVTNHRAQANLTHIFNYDASLTSFSSNLLFAPPYSLFPSPAAVGDMVYFGIDTTVANSGPFTNLLFDITQVASATTSYSAGWEIWTGSWAAFTQRDNTALASGELFTAPGQNIVAWPNPSGWVTTTVNGVTGYWVRARLTALTGTFNNPIQGNRNIQSITWPYVELPQTESGGHVSALARMKVNNYSGLSIASGTDYVFAGLRSVGRGDDFTGFINLADEQNPTGITVTAGTGSAFGADINAPSGRSLQYTTVAAAWTQVGYITFDSTIARQFYGRYRAFLTVRQVGGSANQMSARLAIGGLVGLTPRLAYSSTAFVPVITNPFVVLDLGEITFPGTDAVSANMGEFNAFLEVNSTSTTPDLYLEQLVLIPTDEMYYGSFAQNGTRLGFSTAVADTHLYLDADNLSKPNRGLNNFIIRLSDGVQADTWARLSTQLTVKQTGPQRLWFFTVLKSSNILYAPPSHTHSVELFTNQRYLLNRGAG